VSRRRRSRQAARAPRKARRDARARARGPEPRRDRRDRPRGCAACRRVYDLSMRLAFLLLAGACNAAAAAPAAPPKWVLVEKGFGPTGTVRIKVETVVTGLEVPWSIGFLADGKMLVTERPGRVRLVDHGRLLGEPVATISSSGREEGGLLGLA